MRIIISTLILLFIITPFIYGSPVYFSFQGFTGSYFVDKYDPVYNAPSDGSEKMFDLATGTHTFGISGYTFAEVTFTIDTDGKITNVSNATAATAIDTMVNDVQCGKLIFHTTKIFINASSASYVLSAYNNPYPWYQKGNKHFVLIKGLSYYIATEFSSLTIPGLNYQGNIIPELFWFSVDEKGDVQPFDNSLVNTLAAEYKHRKLKLNTIPVQINLKDYQTTEIRIQGHSPIIKDSKLYFIRGLGILLKYNVNSVPSNFYFIPM